MAYELQDKGMVCEDRQFNEKGARGLRTFFIRSPMQRKYAAKAAHGVRGE